ncbi:complement C1q subcomponent subunit C-like [Siniperca chuatsi]|uniref:complement C1q subcomponent subunit C-like n=1 Tax=Siniperca chuatsi TaxID=119488 RepID=UPI001CE0967F|nr:complement C1q subcomponent subunit C-like [Siniperca chuatsi]
MSEQVFISTEQRNCYGRDYKKVIFSALAEHGGEYGPFNTDKTVVYNTVITNLGGAYNNTTGIFSAPVAGVYYFTFFYHAGGEHKSVLLLFKNCDLIAKTSDHKTSSDTADNGGNAVFVQLQKGDEVYVSLKKDSHVWADGRHTTFSGFLVTQL